MKMEHQLTKCPICHCPCEVTDQNCRRCECNVGLLRDVLKKAKEFENEGKWLQKDALCRNVRVQ